MFKNGSIRCFMLTTRLATPPSKGLPWISLLIVLSAVIIAVATAFSLLGLGAPPPAATAQPPQTATQTQQTQTSGPPAGGPSVSYNAELANKGLSYFKDVGCVACHSIKSLGVSGGNVGPDLSKALFSDTQWLGKFYRDNGLQNPASDPAKAAELLAKFLTQPPRDATTMTAQIAAYKSLYGDQWDKEYVPALVEMLKMAASK